MPRNHIITFIDDKGDEIDNSQWIGNIQSVSVSLNASSIVTKETNGKEHLYMWGDNAMGESGQTISTANENILLPKEVPNI